MTNAVNLASLAVSGALNADANGNVGLGTTSPSVSGMEISRATGVSPTPVELRLTTTTNDSGWSTTNPWGRLSFYSADASVGGAKVHASIQTTAQSSAGGNSNLDFFVTDTANGTLFRTLSFQGAGTNTTQTLFYSGGGANTMTLTANGDLGLNTASPITDSITFVRGVGRNAILDLCANGNTPSTSGLSILQGTDNAAYMYNRANGSLIFGTSNTLRAFFAAGGNFLPGVDNTYSAGQSGVRWSAIWAANGTIQTSDARQKNTITDSDLGLAFIASLRPVSYKWNVGRNIVSKDDEGNDVVTPRAGIRTHYGLIAQEVKEALGEKDFGGFVYDSETDEMGLRYDQLISPLIKAIQEQQAMIDELKAKVAALEGAA